MKIEKVVKSLWGIRHVDSKTWLFEYKTHQGNTKKALFNSEKLAQQAINSYITGNKWSKLSSEEWETAYLGTMFN